MTEAIQRKLNDSAAARWTALVLIALAMFFAYMFVDVMSPLQSLIESERGWDSGVSEHTLLRNTSLTCVVFLSLQVSSSISAE